jgi:hypothetical protein
VVRLTRSTITATTETSAGGDAAGWAFFLEQDASRNGHPSQQGTTRNRAGRKGAFIS